MIYQRKPLRVEAEQFTDEMKDRVYVWATSIQNNVTHGLDEAGQPILKIPTREGVMICAIGDYLIREPHIIGDRKLYPCKPEIFEAAYDTVAIGAAQCK